jgi:probable phosphoglycerate mutase
VGAGTDIPLVEEHRSRCAGRYLLAKAVVPDRIVAAPLKRTMQTANLIVDEMKLDLTPAVDGDFTEIDYGADENKTEDEVRYRLGREYVENSGLSGSFGKDELMKYGDAVIKLWNTRAVVPPGWRVDTDGIIASWKNLADGIGENETVLVCSSNGIIRFAPHILDESDAKDFADKYDLKVATGSVSVFKNDGCGWKCMEWNTKPFLIEN